MISDDNILSENNANYVINKFFTGDYTQLSYLESQATTESNGSYIDLGFPLKKNCRIEAQFELVPVTVGNRYAFFGSVDSTAGIYTSTFCLDFFATNVQLCMRQFGVNGFVNEYDPFKIITIVYDYGKYYVDGILRKDFGSGNDISLYNCYLFAINNGNKPRECSVSKLYRFILKDDEHQLNLIPAKRKTDDTLGLYDTVNDVFYANSGKKAFVGGQEIASYFSKLPSRKEYLESTESQYVDLGIHTTNKTRIKMRCSMTKIGTTKGFYAIIFGDSYPGWELGHEIYVWKTNYGVLGIRASYGNELFDSDIAINVGDMLDIDFNQNHLTVNVNDGEKIVEHTFAKKNFTSPETLEVFRIPRDAPEYYGNMKLYSAQIYEDDVLVQDLICVDDNGRPAVFDRISRRKFYNLGIADDFVEGPTISATYSSIKPATLKMVSDILLYPEKDYGSEYQVSSGNLKYILDFVTKYNKSDGKVGLLNRVNNDFYMSTTSEDFIAGPEL